MKKTLIHAFFAGILCIGAISCDDSNNEKSVKQSFSFSSNADKTFRVVRTDKETKEQDVLFDAIKLGVKTDAVELDCSKLKLESISKAKTVKEEFTMVAGKRKMHAPVWSEQVLTYEAVDGYQLRVVVRTAKDGFAFRYCLDSAKGGRVKFLEELTSWKLPQGVQYFAQNAVQGYEEFYNPHEQGERAQNWNLPILFHTKGDKTWGLLAESEVTSSYCALQIKTDGNGLLKGYYPGRGDKSQPVSELPWESPWRCVMAGGLGDIVESTMIDDLSSPSVIGDTSWIQPGKAAWVYWAYNHGSKDYAIVKQYIDLAAEMKWPYVLIDWEWDQMGNGGNVNDAIRYAKDKGVKVLLWYNSYGNPWTKAGPYDRLLTHEVRVEEFKKLNEWGVSGIKADFFGDDTQESFQYYEGILQDALAAKLLVNFHGATIPHGWSRTYPNLVSHEAVFGAEQYNNGGRMTEGGANHNVMLPYTRNVIGPMDYTPTAFTDSQHKHTTTHTHELALTAIFESAIQHMADRPSGFLTLPQEVRDYLTAIPAAWDDTKYIEGYPGKWVVLARRTGKTWYIAGLNGSDEEREVVFPEQFEKLKNATARGYSDGEDLHSFVVRDAKLSELFPAKLAKKGGFIVVVDEQ